MGGTILRKKFILTVLLIVLDITLMYIYYMIPYKMLYKVEFFFIMLKAPLFLLTIELCLKKHSSFDKALIALILMILSSAMQISFAYNFFDPGNYAFIVVFTILFLTIPLMLYSLIHFIRAILQKSKRTNKKEKTGI